MQERVATPELELVGKVRWCNYTRGIVSFQPDRSDARKHELRIYLRNAGDSALLRTHARPDQWVRMRYEWEPDTNVLAPWQAKELILKNGERLAARYV
jgi:hypothetical protein